MKRSDTLFRHQAALLYDTGASIREMVYAITQKLNSNTIGLLHFIDLGLCDRIGSWIRDNDGDTAGWGIFTGITVSKDKDRIYFTVESDFGYRDEYMYSYSLDELIYLHNEIEKIYKYVVKGVSVDKL